MRTHTLRIPLLLALLVALAGCSSMGLAPAKSFTDRLAYAYGVHTAVLQTAALEVNAGGLSSTEAKSILVIADNARALLDASKVAYGIANLEDAERRLLLATALLEQLRNHLRSVQT